MSASVDTSAGQYDDAKEEEEGPQLNPSLGPLSGEQIQQWFADHGRDAHSDEEDDDDDEYDAQEEDWEASAESMSQMGRVEDADWELARGDFTKMFNRSRQLAQVAGQTSSSANKGSSKHNNDVASVPMPAMNRSHNTKAQKTATEKVSTSRGTHAVAATDGGDPAPEASSTPADKIDAQLSQLQRHFSPRVRIHDAYDPSAIAGGALSANVPRKGNAGTGEKRVRDKSDRSTVQQVLDPRTMVILFKMLQRGLLRQIDGVISTGKEANVYHASSFKHRTTSEMLANGEVDAETAEEGIPLALKIYKTTILVFKDRDRYITGEFRFRHGYARHNPRKMVKLWAEKEARNLKRLVGAGMRCPRPIELRDHVLVMEFLQDETGRNSPRLRDAEHLIDARREAGEGNVWEELYAELVVAIRVMFHQCHLVHADLSEYNVLYHHSRLFIIDVSQSVEHDHPFAFDFLRADIAHVDDYFSKRGGVRTLGLRKTFEWVVRPPVRPSQLAGDDAGETSLQWGLHHDEVRGGKADHDDPTSTLNTLSTLASGPFSKFDIIVRGPGENDDELASEIRAMMRERDAVETEHTEGDATREATDLRRQQQRQDDKQNDAVFRQAYIPQTLNEVYDPERDVDRHKQGQKDDLIYANVIGVDAPQAEPDGTSRLEDSDAESDSDDSNSSDGSDDPATQSTPRGHKHEDRDAKKERKKAVKEAAREKRKTKMPKAEKKRKMRTSKK